MCVTDLVACRALFNAMVVRALCNLLHCELNGRIFRPTKTGTYSNITLNTCTDVVLFVCMRQLLTLSLSFVFVSVVVSLVRSVLEALGNILAWGKGSAVRALSVWFYFMSTHLCVLDCIVFFRLDALYVYCGLAKCLFWIRTGQPVLSVV